MNNERRLVGQVLCEQNEVNLHSDILVSGGSLHVRLFISFFLLLLLLALVLLFSFFFRVFFSCVFFCRRALFEFAGR